MRVSVVIPCFNEIDRLDHDAFRRCELPGHELRFVFVDDGSSDGTGELLERLVAEREGRWTTLSLPENRGKAEAVRRGVIAALKDAPDAVGYWDADLATPLSEIARFVAVLVERPAVDAVLGARVKILGRSIERKTYRHLFGRGFATLASNLLDLPVYDTQCGAKLLRVNADTAAVFAEPFLSRWVFDVELIARYIGRWRPRGLRAEDRIVELPLLRWVDVAGSKIGPKDALMALADLLRIARAHRRMWRG